MISSQRFKEHYGYSPPRNARLAGSLVFLGNHLHACQGLSLAGTLSASAEASGSPSQGNQIEILHANHPDPARISVSNPSLSELPQWVTPIFQLLQSLNKQGVPLRACQVAVASDVLAHDWMGGASALQSAFAMLYREFYPYTLTRAGTTAPPERDTKGHLPELAKEERVALAHICAQHDPTQIPHALTSLFCHFGQFLELDFHDGSMEQLPSPPDIVAVLGLPRLEGALDLEFAENFCDQLLQLQEKLQVQSLRALELKDLPRFENRLTDGEHSILTHVLRENRRVLSSVQALLDGDTAQLGQYMLQSLDSLRNLPGGCRPELDRLVLVAGKHPGCLGSTCIPHAATTASIHLVLREQKESFIKHLQKHYPRHAGDFVKPVTYELGLP